VLLVRHTVLNVQYRIDVKLTLQPPLQHLSSPSHLSLAAHLLTATPGVRLDMASIMD